MAIAQTSKVEDEIHAHTGENQGCVNQSVATLRATTNAARFNTMGYSLAAAASATGLNKTTVLRAIKTGKIFGTRSQNGEWYVEPAELHRVYPSGPRQPPL